jgi:A/G-specific adenine glycosylase
MVKRIITDYDRIVPSSLSNLLLLPGVSDYIASAVRCFAWNFPDPLIDTNTVRIAGRILGLEIRDSSRRNPLFRTFIKKAVDSRNPKTYNYSLLDIGATICKARVQPDCISCPLNEDCSFGRSRLGI